MHDFWGEVRTVEGSVRDLSLNQTFFPGHDACRPPGMRYGPDQSADDCVLFEVRHYKA